MEAIEETKPKKPNPPTHHIMDVPKPKNYCTIQPSSNGDDGEYQPSIIEPSFKEKNGGTATVALN